MPATPGASATPSEVGSDVEDDIHHLASEELDQRARSTEPSDEEGGSRVKIEMGGDSGTESDGISYGG